jgi:protein-S-isoprenylcysteine O-methyltransferase Ste14
MRASDWEFKNRAWIFGMIFCVSFPLYALDNQNATALLANWLALKWQMNAEELARSLFAIATIAVAAAAMLRTWGSSYLASHVVYASAVKSETLVADGPYRWVRNPLYLANVLLAIGFGAMMNRAGFAFAIVATLIFNYRLIFREESELRANLGAAYQRYARVVPRLWPLPWPRISSAGSKAKWSEGFKAEAWVWGFAASVGAFAITLNITYYLVILSASLALFWIVSLVLGKNAESRGAGTGH